ncbi:MAG TPA: hypothetical protein VMU18_09375 [Rhodoblastus sp.]|nr:hypothetical protein [Rhodoblastus sp.]
MRKNLFALMAAFGASLISIATAAQSHPGQMRTAEGQAYWEGDPGPVTDPYWTQGQYKYDPNGYLERNWRDPEYHPMTVIGEHSGKANCVFRQRVQITAFDYYHPIVRVCRTPPHDR